MTVIYPAHKHDCKHCVFLGQICTVTPGGVGNECDVWDLYFCEVQSAGAVSVLARYGEESSYMSYPVFAKDRTVTRIYDELAAMTTESHGAFVALAAQLTIEHLKARAVPACETCKRPVPVGYRFCKGLSICWQVGVGL